MTKPPKPIKRVLIRIGIFIAMPFCLLAGCLALDAIPMSAARPPKNLTTIQDFEAWKAGAIMGKGTYEFSGTNYTVMLAPAGRYLASGPSAYLFDENGQFFDWTSDMGDFYTVKHHLKLAGVHVKNIEHERR